MNFPGIPGFTKRLKTREIMRFEIFPFGDTRTTKIPDGKLSNHGKISGGLLGIFAIKTKLKELLT